MATNKKKFVRKELNKKVSEFSHNQHKNPLVLHKGGGMEIYLYYPKL